LLRKTVSGVMLMLLLTSMLTSTFNIQSVKAWAGTVYIRADGSIDPPTAPIQRDRNTYTFTGNIYDSIVVERSNIIIDGNGYTLQGDGTGIGFNLTYMNNVTIKRTNIKGFLKGIELSGSHYNVISENNVTSNGWFGLLLGGSHNNSITQNTIANNEYAIGIHWSSGNFLYGNLLDGNKFGFGVFGFELSHFIHDVDTSNRVNGKPIYYLINQHDMVINSSNYPQVGFLALVNSTNIIVEKLTLTENFQGLLMAYTKNTKIQNSSISNNDFGVYLIESSGNNFCGNNVTNNRNYGVWLHFGSFNNSIAVNDIKGSYSGVVLSSSHENSVAGNNVKNNEVGVYLHYSSYNSVFGNNVTNNTYSFFIDYSFDNMIYHNNFINNLNKPHPFQSGCTNTWDDGYPSGGNYWSDYTDVDLYSGPYQNETGSDGIWDHPYVIDANNTDRYPLVNPWTPTPPPVPKFLTLPFRNPDIVVGWIFDPDDQIYTEGGHFGIDFINDLTMWESFYVTAAADGEAFWAEEKDTEGKYKGWGRYVYIKHNEKDTNGRNYYTLYAHLESVNPNIPKEGEGTYSVRRGEIIGKAGDTGAPAGLIHLHFEVHKGDARSWNERSNRIDPYDLNQDIMSYYGEGATSIRCGTNYLWTTDPPSLLFNLPPFALFRHYPISAGWPMLDFILSYLSGYEVYEEIVFDASPSFDLDGKIVRYEWNFDDGTIKFGEIVTHAFVKEGTYWVKLTVEDDRNQKRTFRLPVYVSDPTEELLEKLKADIKSISQTTSKYLEEEIFNSAKKSARAADSFRERIAEGTLKSLVDIICGIPLSPLPKDNPVFARIAWKVLMEEFDFFTKEILEKIIDPALIYSYYDILIHDICKNIENNITQIMDVKKQLLSEINDLDLKPAELRLYLKDLSARRRANLFLSQFYAGQANLLHSFDDIKRQDEKSWTLKAGKFCWWTGVVSASALNPIIGKIVGFSELTRETIANIKALDANSQMYLLSHYLLRKSVFNPSIDPFINVVQGISQNTIQGLENIRNRLIPHVVEGRINQIEVNKNTLNIEIENTCGFEAEFKLLVVYRQTYASYELIPGVVGRYYHLPTWSAYPENEEWITIQPGSSYTIKIHGLPQEHSWIGVYLLGKSDTGIYGLHYTLKSVDRPWYEEGIFSWLSFGGGSPVELRVCDPQGRVTGLVNGKIIDEIPNAVYDRENETVIVYFNSLYPHNLPFYRYEIKGTDTGNYSINATYVQNGEATVFAAKKVPITQNATHQYTINWTALSLGEEGVTVMVDSDGDGVFERTFASDSELIRSEYLAALGDLNGDGKVDMRDLSIVASAFGSYPRDPRWNPIIADVNKDNKINMKDLVIICKNFGKTYT